MDNFLPTDEKLIFHPKNDREKTILVGVATPTIKPGQAEEHLNELQHLAETANAEVVQVFLQRIQKFNPATFVGEGKVIEIKDALASHDAKMVVFDEELSGSQIRNLEKRLPGTKVLDRTGLILDIFAKRAKTAESRLMVEIAQLEYFMPRLTGAWTNLCRQHNGGIGTKGPGETQLETDRRLIRKRILDLKKKLQKIEEARERQAKSRNDVFHVGIVGYTNAGKSTLINRLTKAGVYVENKLFATLDSTTRQFYVGEGNSIILSDTVGFIRKLPHNLVDTFKSTLGVAAHANCILEVIDGSATDYQEHMEVTQRVLDQIIDLKTPRIRLFNKTEAQSEEARTALLESFPDVLHVSAKENIGMDKLKQLLIQKMNDWQEERLAQKEVEKNAPDGWVSEGSTDES